MVRVTDRLLLSVPMKSTTLGFSILIFVQVSGCCINNLAQTPFTRKLEAAALRPKIRLFCLLCDGSSAAYFRRIVDQYPAVSTVRNSGITTSSNQTFNGPLYWRRRVSDVVRGSGGKHPFLARSDNCPDEAKNHCCVRPARQAGISLRTAAGEAPIAGVRASPCSEY